MGRVRTIVVSLVLAGAIPVWAADDPARTKADVAYQAGLADFQAGRFQEAFDHFHRAYLLDNAPTLLFNMARAAEEMGDADTAIDHYRLYLDRVPDAEDRPEVERRIRVMEKLAARPAESEPPVQGAVVVSQERPSLMPWAWTALGFGVAGLGVGAWLGVRASDLESEHASTDEPERLARTRDDGESAALGANIAFGVGGALVATGVVLWWLDARDDGAVTMGPGPGGFLVSGRF